MLEFLEKEQISEELIKGIEGYRKEFPTPPELADRVPEPHFHYYGKEVWEEAIAALLCGQNLLLGRAQGYRQERAGGKSGLCLRPPHVERFFPY
jgi:hypothetical protein